MAADEALKELLEVSNDVRAAVIFERGGAEIASTTDAGAEIAEIADAMLAYGNALRADGAAVERLEAALEGASVLVVRDGERAIVAVTGPEPVSALVFHDLRACVRKVRRRARQRAHAAS
jgi:hypothetical protein